MKKWSLLIVLFVISSSLFYFNKNNQPQIKSEVAHTRKLPFIKTPSPVATKNIIKAEETKKPELTHEECEYFLSDQIFKITKENFTCFTYEFWSDFLVGDNDLMLTMSFNPYDYLATFGQSTALQIDFKVESSNKELLDFNQEFSHFFQVNLKSFILNFENPILREYVYNRVNIDPEFSSDKLNKTAMTYKEYCLHKKDPKQFIKFDTQWTSTAHEGILQIPDKGLFQIKFHAGAEVKSSCLAI